MHTTIHSSVQGFHGRSVFSRKQPSEHVAEQRGNKMYTQNAPSTPNNRRNTKQHKTKSYHNHNRQTYSRNKNVCIIIAVP